MLTCELFDKYKYQLTYDLAFATLSNNIASLYYLVKLFSHLDTL